MSSASVGAVLLAVTLAWRASVSLAVVVDDETLVADWRAGLTDSSEARLARSLATLPVMDGPEDLHLQRARMLTEYTPRRSQVYVLHSFSGPTGLLELMSWARLSVMLHPRMLQPISSMPLPESAHQPPFDELPAFVFDLRPGLQGLDPSKWELVDDGAGATVWRERRGR